MEFTRPRASTCVAPPTVHVRYIRYISCFPTDRDRPSFRDTRTHPRPTRCPRPLHPLHKLFSDRPGRRRSALLRNPSAPHTWKRRRASRGQGRLSSAIRRPGASPRSSARKKDYWRRWRRLLRQPTLHRQLLIRTAPGSRASRSPSREESACPSR